MLQELVHGYRTKCSKDAKLLEDAIEAGEAISMYSKLFQDANQPSLSTNEKLLHSTRLFYFMGYCMKYNNGIPMLEVLSDWIDNDEKRKVLNAVKSQSNLFDVLIEQGIDINILAEYIDEREITEYAINEEKKSTGVFKRILEHKKSSIKKEPKTIPSLLEETLKDSEKFEAQIRITKTATKEDVERLKEQGAKDIKVGQKITYLPEPTNKEELFERFEKLHAQRYFETLQDIFRDKYGVGNKRIIENELTALNSFIGKANKLSTKETFQNKWVEPQESDLHEYSRLSNDYYKNPNKKFYPYGYFNSNAVQVYAQNFLYKEWLEKELVKYHPIEQVNTDNNVKEIEVWESEYELRHFIHTATRWDINVGEKNRTEQNPYSIFDYKVEHARNNFEKFRTQLNRKLSSLHPDFWKAIEIDLNDKFLKGINKYIKWYNENKPEFEKFQPYCPYTIMLSVIESTKKEILKYFPELHSQSQKSILADPILSVPDWCIVFYYLDEAGIQVGSKINRMEKFIEDNNVVSPSGTLTTKTNFKKEYHEIENRINLKNDKKPLPPERIENILHFLKNNKKALQTANNDIEHLSHEIE
jgi:hypothetical protein